MHFQMIVYVTGLAFSLSFHSSDGADTRICSGTSNKFSHPGNATFHLHSLAMRYRHCTIVRGNLELVALPQGSDLAFLKDIEVVTGYVLIALNRVRSIPLDNLKLIRGRQLSKGAALRVVFNREGVVGLERIGLRSLTEIQRGNIHFEANSRLCYVDTVSWSDILTPDLRGGDGWNVSINNELDPRVVCAPCEQSCNGHCWGPTENDCQALTSSVCDITCGNSRCRGPRPDQCCHAECASGCHGPTNSDCFLCRHVNNSGVCEAACPPLYTYDVLTMRLVVNPAAKYQYEESCVQHCPINSMVEGNACVRYCRQGFHNNGMGECVRCRGAACNTECFGIGNPDGPMRNDRTVDANNVKYFKGCNIVRGNVVFQNYGFTGDPYTNTPPLSKKELTEALSSIKVINGYLQIAGWHPDLHDFSAFSSLTTIRGVELFRATAALVIQDFTGEGPQKTLRMIKSLGLRSLQSIDYGNVYIGYMPSLCYEDKVNWTRILKNPVARRNFHQGVLFRNNKRCGEAYACHQACDENGCWGPDDRDCVQCKHFPRGDRCVVECTAGFHPRGCVEPMERAGKEGSRMLD